MRLRETPPPERADVDEVVRRVHDRALRWLRRHGDVDDRPAQERGNEASEATPIDAFARIALAGGTFFGRPFPPEGANDEPLDRKERRFSARCNGFDVHGAVRIAKDDDVGRERLVR